MTMTENKTTKHFKINNDIPAGLNNNETVISHALEQEVQSDRLDTQNNGFLRAWFSVPIGISNPKTSDICSIHITDLQDNIVLTEARNLSGSTTVKLRNIVKDLVNSVPRKTFNVTITTHDKEGLSAQHVITENARTELEAIGQAIIYVVGDIYNELPKPHYNQALLIMIKYCVIDGKPLRVQLGNDGLNHVFTDITEEALCHSNMPKMVVPKDNGMFYALPDSVMTTDLDRSVNYITKGITKGRSDALLAGVDKEVLADLDYCKLRVGVATHNPITNEPVAVSDIKQVYLFNYANVIVNQSVELANTDDEKLSKIIHTLIHSSTDHGWNIEVITVRRGITSRNVVKRNGIHVLEAIESGLMFLADFVYDDFDNVIAGGLAYKTKVEWVKDAVKRCGSTGQPIVLKINDTTHTVKSVNKRHFVSYEEENNLM